MSRCIQIATEEWSFPASNGEGEIFARAWLPPEPKAVVQIAHGMSEHSGRYDEFARYLCGLGFAVVANDHAGHGLSAQGHLGSFSGKAGGFDCAVEDLSNLFTLAEKNLGISILPRVLFGQSMGSLMAALYAERYDDLSALILSATPSAIQYSKVFQFLAAVIATTRGQLARSPLLERLTGSVKNMSEEEKMQARSWLTRDEDKIREFNSDKLCGFDYSAGGYLALLKAYHHVNAKNWGQQIPNVPVLIVAGSADPTSGNGKGPMHFTEQLTKTGHKQVELRLFNHARHELINELNHQEIYTFLGNWINQQVTHWGRGK
ncbi:MAG: lysophospholipase [Coriobacteriia bacterium]|nr:lysophospholipase [Coriobacteriia bacterium]MCL2750451.1 lysophospholipase [Coriobacteriia bacterium]